MTCAFEEETPRASRKIRGNVALVAIRGSLLRTVRRTVVMHVPSIRIYRSPLSPVGVRSTKEVSEIDARRSTWRRITLQIYSMTTIVKGSERWVGQGQGVRGPFRYPTPDTCSIPARLDAKNPWRVPRHMISVCSSLARIARCNPSRSINCADDTRSMIKSDGRFALSIIIIGAALR